MSYQPVWFDRREPQLSPAACGLVAGWVLHGLVK